MAEHSFHLVFKGFTDEASGHDFGSSRERKRGFSALLLCFHTLSSLCSFATRMACTESP